MTRKNLNNVLFGISRTEPPQQLCFKNQLIGLMPRTIISTNEFLLKAYILAGQDDKVVLSFGERNRHVSGNGRGDSRFFNEIGVVSQQTDSS